MLQSYKEIFYGLLFGLGAGIIDADMHARMENSSFWKELVQPRPSMVFYRVLFLFFGLALGWLLWQKNKRERDFRRLKENVDRLHREIAGPAMLMHTKLQLLLTKKEWQLCRDAEDAVRFVYEKSLQIQAMTKERLPAAEP